MKTYSDTEKNHARDAPLVTVCTLAYNHAPFIRQCMDGVMMQVADFGIEFIVHDDASTDGTPEVIREYATNHGQTIRTILQPRNVCSQGIDIHEAFFFPNARGRYIAFCEGDDYWTDPYKLSKQVAYLEAHPESSCCFGRFEVLDSKSGNMEGTFPKAETLRDGGDIVQLRDYLASYRTKYLTCMFRSSLAPRVRKEIYPFVCDIVLFSEFLQHGSGKILDDVFGVYRKHPGGISSTVSGLDFTVLQLRALRSVWRNNRAIPSISKAYLGQLTRLFDAWDGERVVGSSRIVDPIDLSHYQEDFASLKRVTA